MIRRKSSQYFCGTLVTSRNSMISIISMFFIINIVSSVSSLSDLAFIDTLPSNPLNYIGSGSYASSTSNNESCSDSIWCSTNDLKYFEDEMDAYFGEDDEVFRGFWLDAPPDDIVYMPPPPMPPAIQAMFKAENISLKDYIINSDAIDGSYGSGQEREPLCNFCKIFADPKLYPPIEQDLYPIDTPDDASYMGTSSKDNESFVTSFYFLIFTAAIIGFIVLIALIKYKKWKIFPMSESCPILASTGILGHNKSSSSSSGSPSDTRIPVVNEKSPQSIIMDAPLCASLVKKSTISTTGKYWKRIPNQSSGSNIFSMEDRGIGGIRALSGLRSLGGSSISDHPYSDAASCTSSPVYAELDPSVAGSCHTPTIIGPPGSGAGSVVSSFSPYAFAPSNTYGEVPDSLRGVAHPHLGAHHAHHQGLSPAFLTDSSTYDNAAYLPASSQSFIGNANHYSTRSLRRLAAQRAAALNNVTGQAAMPLLAGHPYHQQPYHHQASTGTLHPQHHLQSTPIHGCGNGQFSFLTGGRPLKKSRSGASSGNFRTANRMNHYVTQGSDISGGGNIDLIDEQQHLAFPSFLNNAGVGDNLSSNSSSNRKSSSSSQTYTEMPLLNTSGASSSHNNNNNHNQMHTGNVDHHHRMSETYSSNDLNSGSSSSSSGGAANHHPQLAAHHQSNTSLKRPLPPVPGSIAGHVRL